MLWQAPIGFDLGFRGAAEAVVTVDEVNDLVYIVVVECREGKLFALDKQTGEIVWYKSKATDNVSFKGNSVLLSGGTIFAVADDPNIYCNGRMLSIDASSQDIETTFDIPDLERSNDVLQYTLCNDRLVVGYSFEPGYVGYLIAYDPTSPTIVWQKEFSEEMTGTIACNITGNIIYVPTDPYLYALDVTTGEEIWKYTGYGAIYNPSVANGIVYFLSDTNMYAIDEATGERVFRYPLGYEADETTQVAICDGMVYFSGSDGTCGLFALGT
jgi:outer membrane protein assembly factor BamB